MKLKGKNNIIGMVHLSGPSVVEKAIEEIKIYEEEGLYGVIIENYHGSTNDVIYTLKELAKHKTKLKIGINILPNEVEDAFNIANEYNVDFIQFDYISGTYMPNIKLDIFKYANLTIKYPKIFIMGGVWPKYYTPISSSNLYTDLNEASMISNAIVVTGKGTGQETPLKKIKEFKKFLKMKKSKTKLIIGAGITKDNIKKHLKHANGAIIGSAFKPGGNTTKMVDRDLVREIMNKIK